MAHRGNEKSNEKNKGFNEALKSMKLKKMKDGWLVCFDLGRWLEKVKKILW